MKTNLKTLILLCILLICCFHANAQYDYRKGFVVTISKDTIHGLIEYGNIRTNSSQIYFKKDSSSEAIIHTPYTVQSVTIPNYRHYISRTLQLRKNPQKFFLEYLLNGIVNLYFLKDDFGEVYYFFEKDGEMFELTNKKVEIYKEDGLYTKDSKKYIGYFKYLTRECSEISPMIDKMEFDHNSFINLTKKYHDYLCDSMECIIYSREEKELNDTKWITKFGFSLAYRYDKLTLINRVSYLIPSFPFPVNYPEILNSNICDLDGHTEFILTQTSVSPGVYFNVSPNWRTSLQIELWYERVKYELFQNPLTISNIFLPVLFKREFFYYNKLSPFINIGYAFKYNLRTEMEDLYFQYTYPEQQGSTYIMDTKTIQHESYDLFIDRKINFAFLAGFGASYDLNSKSSIVLEFRYTHSTMVARSGLDENISLSSTLFFESLVGFLNYNYSF